MKYTIIHNSEPSKIYKKEEDVNIIHKKAINLLINELTINEHLKTGN